MKLAFCLLCLSVAIASIKAFPNGKHQASEQKQLSSGIPTDLLSLEVEGDQGVLGDESQSDLTRNRRQYHNIDGYNGYAGGYGLVGQGGRHYGGGRQYYGVRTYETGHFGAGNYGHNYYGAGAGHGNGYGGGFGGYYGNTFAPSFGW